MIDDAAIRAALIGPLTGAAGLPAVFGEGKVYSPEPDVAHIRTRLRRQRERKVNTALTVASGSFDVTVCVPSDSGVEIAEAIAAAVKSLYAVDSYLSDLVRVLEVSAGTAAVADEWLGVAVEITWEVYDG